MSEQLEVATLGELLGVIEPVARRSPLEAAALLEQSIGGAEVNVALCLARLGHHVGWCGAVGDDPFGRAGVRLLRGEGVDVSRVVVSALSLTGVYFKELPFGRLRNYAYRDSSPASRTTWTDIDVDYVLSGRAVHLTGITALLSDAGYDLVLRLMRTARARGVHVFFDVNIRTALLRGRDPVQLLVPLAREADTVFLSRSEATTLFSASEADALQATLQTMRAAAVVVHDSFGAQAIMRDSIAKIDAREVDVIDPTGAGDAFVAGYVSGWLEELPIDGRLLRAEYCAARAVSSCGDSPVGLERVASAGPEVDDR